MDNLDTGINESYDIVTCEVPCIEVATSAPWWKRLVYLLTNPIKYLLEGVWRL